MGRNARSPAWLAAFVLVLFQATAQISLPALGTSVSQDFNTLAPTGTGSFVPGSHGWPEGWAVVETLTNANTNYAAGTGASNNGDTYSLGPASTAERALGGLRSGSLSTAIGASFINKTGAIITSIYISYAGEQWRFGEMRVPEAPDRLDFQLSTNATSLTTGNWTNEDALDFMSPVFTGAPGSKDGNSVRDTLAATIGGLFVPPDSILWIRWVDHDAAGSDDALGIDDFSLSPEGYHPVAHIVPIVKARTQSVGTLATVAGRVTSADQLGSPSYLQDGTGGIPIFDFNLSNSVEIGDSLVVTGPIGFFQNQIQISGSGITFFRADSSSRIPSPRKISIGDLAANEGLLVTVLQVEFVNKSQVFYPQSTERMTSGSIQADLRVDGDTDLPGLAKPPGRVDITGVVGRFQSNAQLLPRFREDVPGTSEPRNPSDSIPLANSFDLMNWNLEFLGAEREDFSGEEFGPSNEQQQVQNIKTVLLSAGPDLIAVQEVSDETFFNQLVSEMLGYASACLPRYSHDFDDDGTFPEQKLCFIYNMASVNVISSRPMFERLFDKARTADPTLLSGIPGGDPGSFWASGRLPFILIADVTIDHVTERISFINVHLKSGGSSPSDYERRKYDMQVLKDSLDAHHGTDQFVILGDFNDDLDSSILPGNRPTPYATLVDDTTRYSPISLALSLSGARSTVSFSDVVDHQIVSNELNEKYVPGSIRVLAPFQLVVNYATTTSDHLPVLSRFQFIGPNVSAMPLGKNLPRRQADTNDGMFVLYPNPTRGAVNIRAPSSHEETIVSGTMYESSGRQIIGLDGTVAELGDAFTEALAGRQGGMYFIKLSQQDQIVVLRLAKL